MNAYLKLIPAALIGIAVGAQAAVTITIQEVGPDVVVTGSGSIASDWFGEAESTQTFSTDVLDPSNYTIQVGSNPATVMNLYTLQAIAEDPANGVPRFGNGSEVSQATNNTGDAFGVSFPDSDLMQLAIPADYVPDEEMRFSVTFRGATFESLGIDLGSSTWNWTGQPQLDENVTLNVIPRADTPPVAAAPVPALGAFGLMGLASAIGVAGVAMARRRKQS